MSSSSLFIACVIAGTFLAASSTRLGPRRRRPRFFLALPGAWIGLFLAGFGATGLVLDALGIPPWPAAALFGLSFSLPIAFAVEGYLRTHTAREIDALEGRAREATVTVAIPPHGLGRILFVAKGKRVSRAARTSDGTALAAGRPVLIVSLRRHVAVVEPLAVR